MLTVQQGANRTLLGILAVGLWVVATAGTVASIYWVRQIFLGVVMLLVFSLVIRWEVIRKRIYE